MKREVMVSVSTLTVKDYQQIVEYAKSLQGAADMIHCDIMDGKFVPAKTYDNSVVYSINQNCLTMLDVHLMVDEPAGQIDNYINAGANIITIHYEAFKNKEELFSTLKYIKSKSVLAGLSFNPSTSIEDIKLYLHDVDVVLVMGVEPGAYGQKFIPSTFEKIKKLASLRESNAFSFKIEVDGGVNAENASALTSAGADILVSGNYVFKAQDKKEAIDKLKG